MKIVRLANFVTPTSGGLRTALRCLGEGYVAAGHEPVLIVPGPSYSDSMTSQGRIIVLPGPTVPGLGGYRVLLDRKALRRLLFQLRPDRLEVSDRTTLRWTGAWAKRHRVPSVMVSHESLAGLLRVAHLPAALAPPLNRATARSYDRIICTTEWAAREFDTNVSLVPLGVDLDFFHPLPAPAPPPLPLAQNAPPKQQAATAPHAPQPPGPHLLPSGPPPLPQHPHAAPPGPAAPQQQPTPHAAPQTQSAPPPPQHAQLPLTPPPPPAAGAGTREQQHSVMLICCTRLSVEKRPQRALLTLRSLLSQGISAHLVMAGDGPLRAALESEARDLPVTFTGWISDRRQLAHLLATADIALAPGPIETFGLAALEALACGTPVVASASSALPAVIGKQAGASVEGEDLSPGVRELLSRPEHVRRQAARARAEQFGWDAAVKGFLAVHEEIGDAYRGAR